MGNALGAAAIATILLVAFGLQFGLNEPPCPLCNLQRVAFVLCSFGFVLNLRFGVQPVHYGLTLFGALFGVGRPNVLKEDGRSRSSRRSTDRRCRVVGRWIGGRDGTRRVRC